MPLTKEEEEIFRQLRRIKEREYARIRRDKNRKKKYGERKTRKKGNDLLPNLLALSKALTPQIPQTKTKDIPHKKRDQKSPTEK